jgi:hypothetical protein
MPGDEHHAHRHQLVGRGDRLLAIAVIVGRDHFDLLPEHAACGIEVGHRERHAALGLLAEPGIGAGERPGQADQDLGMGDRGDAECRRKATISGGKNMASSLPGRPAVTIGGS